MHPRIAAALLALLLCSGAPPLRAQALRAITESVPPASFREQGRVTGYAVELVREIMRRSGQDAPVEILPWARGYRLARTTPNVALFPTARTAEREHLFQWLCPLWTMQWNVYARRGSNIRPTNLEDLRALGSIGTYRDDVRDQFLTGLGFTNLDQAPDQTHNLHKLLRGRVDVLIAAPEVVATMLRKEGLHPDVVEVVMALRSIELCVAFSTTTSPAVVTGWREAFESMRRDGTVRAIRARWEARHLGPAPSAP